MTSRKLIVISLVISLSGLILAACGNGEPPTPTTDPNQLITQVAQTIEANLTQTAAALPTQTSTPEPTQTPAPTETPAITATLAGAAGIPTAAGGVPAIVPDGMTYSADVTIPDNTQLSPSSEFVKTWRVKNTGTTSWNTGYRLVYWDGVANTEFQKVIPTPQVKLTGEVKPGAEAEVSVKMVAPSKNGTYKIWWRLLNAAGNPFGDSLYAQIIVNDGTLTLTPEVSPSKTPTK